MLQCSACGRETPFGARVCTGCGQNVPAGGFPLGASYAGGLGQVCPRCDAFVAMDLLACAECGAHFVPVAREAHGGRFVHATTQPDFARETIRDSVPPAIANAAVPVAVPSAPAPAPPPHAAPAEGTAPAEDTHPGAPETTAVERVPGAEPPPEPSEAPRPPKAPPAVPPPRPLEAIPAVSAPRSVEPTPPAAARPAARGKAPIRGAVLEVPPPPGMALKDGVPLDPTQAVAHAPDKPALRKPPLVPAPDTAEVQPSPTSPGAPVKAVTPASLLHAAPAVPVYAPSPGTGTAARGDPAIVAARLSPPTPTGEMASAGGAGAPAARPSGDSRPCVQCGTQVPTSFIFCGHCGHRVAPIGAPAEQATGVPAASAAAKARLILIKGEGVDGISYQLSATDHVAGRGQGTILFPDDRFLSLRHANFHFREGRLYLHDEGSLNGVFVRLRGPTDLRDGDSFLCGEELLRFELLSLPRPAELVSEDGTVFYGTPLRDGIGCRVVQILLGGRMGMVFVPTKPQVTIGRESCDLSFPRDRFISGRHTKLELQGRGFVLTDLSSKNGTYIRIREERELMHGDYVFLGQQLFRVELAA